MIKHITAGTMVNVSSNGNLYSTSNNISDGSSLTCFPYSNFNNAISPNWFDRYTGGNNSNNNNQPKRRVHLGQRNGAQSYFQHRMAR